MNTDGRGGFAYGTGASLMRACGPQRFMLMNHKMNTKWTQNKGALLPQPPALVDRHFVFILCSFCGFAVTRICDACGVSEAPESPGKPLNYLCLSVFICGSNEAQCLETVLL